jgi:23S rRNA (cytidine2498-2'-O)-methyltransferase
MSSSDKNTRNPFIFVVCQHGAEKALRSEVLGNHPTLKLAFSRPGFITFKADQADLPESFSLKSTLARTWGWSLGKIANESAQVLADEIVQQSQFAQCSHVHVWERDRALPGKNGFEPGISPLSAEVSALIEASNQSTSKSFNRVAQANDRVFDIVMVEPNEWW